MSAATAKVLGLSSGEHLGLRKGGFLINEMMQQSCVGFDESAGSRNQCFFSAGDGGIVLVWGDSFQL